jgi:hypothetical protein
MFSLIAKVVWPWGDFANAMTFFGATRKTYAM